MQKVIIIEGCNKSGKTTIVNYLKNNFPEKDFQIIKCSQPEIIDGINQAYYQYIKILEEIKSNSDKNYILDRFHFGSYVYGPIYRKMPDFGKRLFEKIEDEILKLNYMFILAIADKEFMAKKFIEENEEFAKVELIDKEIALFKKTVKMSRLKIFNHNLPKNDLLKNNNFIKNI